MNQAPEQSFNFYSILAVAYMYLVTVLAYLMFMNPGEARFVWLLINAKAVSSLLSFIFFIVVGSYLICLANGIVDGMIAFGLVILLKKVRIAAE
ncbi:MAG TPA: hypothetical protein VMM58_02650 [Bacteroidota bacterium]|nr:hypothetical protein [Bacteroidota bacterium]